MRALGFELPEEAMACAFERFQIVANNKREVVDEELRSICAEL